MIYKVFATKSDDSFGTFPVPSVSGMVIKCWQLKDYFFILTNIIPAPTR